MSSYTHHRFTPWLHGHRTPDECWEEPCVWNDLGDVDGERRRVLCAPSSDLLDPEVPVEWLAELLVLTQATPNLDWLLVTKNPARWRKRVEACRDRGGMAGRATTWLGGIPPRNIWLGTSVENQLHADERIPELLSIPAKVRFLSCEPLVEAVDLWPSFSVVDRHSELPGPRCNPDGSPAIAWVIIGGERGPNARPCHVEWIRSIVRDCSDAGVSAFVKQLGSDTDEWPIDLRVRQLPKEST